MNTDPPGFGAPPIFAEMLPHERMTPEQCLGREARHAGEYRDVVIVGYNEEGELVIRASQMTRERAAFLLLQALKWANGG